MIHSSGKLLSLLCHIANYWGLHLNSINTQLMIRWLNRFTGLHAVNSLLMPLWFWGDCTCKRSFDLKLRSSMDYHLLCILMKTAPEAR